MKNFKLKDSNYLDESPWSNEEFENQDFDADWDALETYLGCMLSVNDFDDLICDPHGIME